MRFRIRYADQIVGVFVVLAIAFLLFILILMGSKQRWFTEDYFFSTTVRTAKGVASGMAITLSGIEIGKVEDVKLDENNNVKVDFLIFESYYDRVKKNSVMQLTASGIVGKALILHPGINNGDPIPPNTHIPSLDFAEGQKLAEKGLVTISQTHRSERILRILEAVEPVMENLQVSLVTVNEILVTLRDALEGDESRALGKLIKNIDDTVVTIDKSLSDTTGNANTLINNIDEVVKNLEELTADPEGLVPELLGNKGSIAKILDDDEVLFEEIHTILVELRKTAEQAREFSTYINSTQPQVSGILEEGRQTLDKTKDVLEGLRNNPLLRGGIPEEREQPSTFESYRDEDF